MAERVAVIGAGIVGIAHAWMEAQHGAQVTLFERHQQARGASVRNFGMLWPIGQPSGVLHEAALRSRQLWSEFVEQTGFWSNPCGSLHIACRPDELEVLQEFAALAPPLGYECFLLGPDEIERRSPAVRKKTALGGLWSPTEMGVNPRQIIGQAPAWLRDRHGVELQFGTLVSRIDLPRVFAADGTVWHFDRATVASGVDCNLLYPELLRRRGMRKCKLQMMRTVRQPRDCRLGALLASGLTLRHYANFQICGSLAKLRERIAVESPDLDRFGIHILAAQQQGGDVIIGDSHEYGDEISPFDKEHVYDLILLELQRFLHLPDWSIAERWHGAYASLSDAVEFVSEPTPGVTVVLSTSGTGMTLSFGLAETLVKRRNSSGKASLVQTVTTSS